ncbi:MAG TPA: hypothetical protein VI911_08780 [Patescibacteria group bacterium]|nr:MAG: hypothetical protein UR43_C0005G0076 [candidate division TM6 bacterium GW2011_GWF2_33_332]HLD91091.1 hypothetical protein [Patescibacteria group bacterium]
MAENKNNIDYSKFLDDLLNGSKTISSNIPYQTGEQPTPFISQENLEQNRLDELLNRYNLQTNLSKDIPLQPNKQGFDFGSTQPSIPQTNIPQQPINIPKDVNVAPVTPPVIPSKTKQITPSPVKEDKPIVKEVKEEVKDEEGFNSILKRLQKDDEAAKNKENEIYEESKKMANWVDFMGGLRGGLEKISAGMARVEGDPNAGKSLKEDAKKVMSDAMSKIEMSKQQRKESKGLVKEALEEAAMQGKAAELDPNSKASELYRTLIKNNQSFKDKLNPYLKDLDGMNKPQLEELQKLLLLQDDREMKLKMQQLQSDNAAKLLEIRQQQADAATKKANLSEERFKWTQKEKDELTSKQQEITKNAYVTSNDLDELKSLFKKSYVGPVDGRLGSTSEKIWNTNKDRSAFYSKLNSFLSNYIKGQSGLAVTDAEYERLKDIVANPNVTADTFMSRLNSFDQTFKRQYNDIVDFYNVSNPDAEKYRLENMKKIKENRTVKNIENKVTVMDSQGKKFKLPKEQLEDSIKQGYKLVE